MKLPRLLMIDDEYARGKAEWRTLKSKLGLIEVGSQDAEQSSTSSILAEVVLCAGQRMIDGAVENDYELIRAAVSSGNAKPWALVLLDVTFLSGPLPTGEAPTGRAGDERFGEEVYRRLSSEYPNLPLVLLTTKEQQSLENSEAPYLAKANLNRREIQKKLIQCGLLDPEQTCALLQLPHVVVSPAALAAFKEANLHAPNKLSILILGETGVGKEVLAEYIHRVSDRSAEPYVAVNVASIPADQLEAELFGIEANAATGVAFRLGKFGEANKGTLFLDEIGDMSIEMQAAILRALENGVVSRIGRRGLLKFDVRFICATNKDLKSMVQRAEFREDLLMRINTITIEMPPLRSRREDIPYLVDMFLQKEMQAEGKIGVTLSAKARQLIERATFPGNVRQLEHLVARLVGAAGHNELINDRLVAAALEATARASVQDYNVKRRDEKVETKSSSTAWKCLAQELPEIMASVQIRLESAEDLMGVLPLLRDSYGRLLRQLAGAALSATFDPVKKKPNKQRAMRLLSGDDKLHGKGPDRIINSILNRKQEAVVTENDLIALLDEWRNHSGQKADD